MNFSARPGVSNSQSEATVQPGAKILYCSSMFAGTGMGRYAFRSLDINNGLSQNTVAAIIQDRFGFMWFGTKDGLNRYDGVSFQTFMKESGTLGNNFITSLYEDCLGQIWIGTDVGVYIYSPSGEKVEQYNIRKKQKINTRRVFILYFFFNLS